MNLTDTEVRKAKPAAKMYRMSDGHGLYIQIQPNGTKLWHYGYRFERRQRLLSIGTYPDVTLAEAREALKEARSKLAAGVNPAAEKQQKKRTEVGTTFGDVCKLWLAHWKADKAPRYVKQMESRLKKDILPAIGGRPIREIEAPDVVAVAKAKDAKGAHELARRSMVTIGQVFRYAIAHGMATRNPAKDISSSDVLKPVKKQNHARVDAKGVPALMAAVESYSGFQTRQAIKLMAYTFVRTGELVGARWEEFSLDGDSPRWDIPAERMKMDSPHIVPLSNQAVDILKTVRELTGKGAYVFNGIGKAKHMSTGTILHALARMGFRGKGKETLMTGHGFRGLASTILHEAGWEEKYIEAQLAHQKRNKVAAAYNHAAYLPQRIQMMQAWADIFDSLAKPQAQTIAAD